MIHLTTGFMDLNGIPVISFIGGDQFRKLSILSLIILVVTVWITCFNVEEDERQSPPANERRSTLRHMLNTIHAAILTLPKPVRRICMVGAMPYLSRTYPSGPNHGVHGLVPVPLLHDSVCPLRHVVPAGRGRG